VTTIDSSERNSVGPYGEEWQYFTTGNWAKRNESTYLGTIGFVTTVFRD
jgi:hypothetical protein